MGKRQPNKKYLLDRLNGLKKDGMDFPMHASRDAIHVVPSKKIIKNTRSLINACEDDDLEYWDITLYANGSVLMNYYNHNGINAMVNIAEAGLSGIFAYRNMYDPVEVGVEELDKIIDIFKKAKQYG